jgi:L,D-peptidoglycan transpeptidase YkuD (ErfK/YbiS/YcfS/YnhG family)
MDARVKPAHDQGWIMRSALFAVVLLLAQQAALAQSCQAPLASATRLVLVTSDGFTTSAATARIYERTARGEPWRALGGAEPALIGRAGMAWSYFFRGFSRKSEPIKVEGDKRMPAGFYRIGKSFGTLPANRPDYLPISHGMKCIDDTASPAYNTVVSRADAGWTGHGENMWRVAEYRRGLLVEYPTNAKARAGSCIFIHVRLPEKTGTGGCVALPQARVEALQDFAAKGAVLAVVPRQALERFKGCLPATAN